MTCFRLGDFQRRRINHLDDLELPIRNQNLAPLFLGESDVTVDLAPVDGDDRPAVGSLVIPASVDLLGDSDRFPDERVFLKFGLLRGDLGDGDFRDGLGEFPLVFHRAVGEVPVCKLDLDARETAEDFFRVPDTDFLAVVGRAAAGFDPISRTQRFVFFDFLPPPLTL